MPNGTFKETVVVKPHPGGVAGAMMSLDEVAKRAWAARNDPRVRGWATRELVKVGSPTGMRDKVQAIMDAFRKKVPYVSDPVKSEFIASPIQLLCLDDHGLCIPGGDCDEFTVGILGAILSIGITGQVVGASYKQPTDQPQHVYGRFMDDAGTWVDFDGTTTYAVGHVHPAARTWIIDPDKGVGAAGLPGGDFVGVSRPPGGLAAGPTYAALLTQLVTQDIPALQAAWDDVQIAIANDPTSDTCSGLGGPASLVQQLQDISDQACTITHNAAVAALGYTGNCGGVGSDRALNAQNSTAQACSLHYYWPGPDWGPYGTQYVTGSQEGTCLDPSFTSAVGTQVGAAKYAVAEAQATAQACATHTALTRRAIHPNAPRTTLGPRGYALGEEGSMDDWSGVSVRQPIGVGALIVTAGDIEQEQKRTLATAAGVDLAVQACTTLDSTTRQEWADFYTALKDFCTRPTCNFWYPGMPANCVMATASSGDTMVSYEQNLQTWQTRLSVCPNTPPTLTTFVPSSPIPTGQALTDIIKYGAIIVGVGGGIYALSFLPRRR